MSFSDDSYSALSKELSKKETAQKKQSYKVANFCGNVC